MKLLAVLLFLWVSFTNALSVSEFVPAFLMPVNESEESSNFKVKPLVEVKRNSSSTKSWYCSRNQGNGSNVFCNKSNASEEVRITTFESSPRGDKSRITDNSVTGNKIGQGTAANQTTLQTQDVKNALQKSQGGFMVPISPNNNVNMNVNQQQLQFNIKY